MRTELPLFLVVMAGGSGTRFWPKSRVHRPKQFLSIGTDAPLIVETIQRLEPLIGRERVRIVTHEDYAPQIKDLLPDLGRNALVLEPCPRNTAPCIGLAALKIWHEDHDGVMAVMPSDHHIADANKLRQLVEVSAQEAHKGNIVTLGIVPSRPETGYGYIESVAETDRPAGGGIAVHSVKRFVEKPDIETAKRYLATGQFFWNSGMFFFRCDTILSAIRTYMPHLAKALDVIAQHLDKDSYQEVLTREFEKLVGTSIDYGIMEPLSVSEGSSALKVIPADMGWNDVGHWSSLHDFAHRDDRGNVVEGPVIALDSSNCVIQADHGLVAALGVDDLIIVKDGDVVLVCPKDRAQDVKALVEQLKKQGRRDLV